MSLQVGGVVEALVSAQGMIEGERWVVEQIETLWTPFGGFSSVALTQRNGGLTRRLWIRNAHLVTRPVGAEPSAEACEGCGCEPGDGRTPGCEHPEGCGHAEPRGANNTSAPEGAEENKR